MSGILGVRGRRSLFASHLVIDETTAMTITRSDQRAQRYAFWVTGVVLFVLWNAGTLVGALGGSAIGEPEALGLDAAVPAAFLALLWPRLDDPTARVVAVGGAAVATLLVPLVPAGVPVLAAAPVAVVAGLRGRAVRETS
jgi:predicted branched-subunit amino acid permease